MIKLLFFFCLLCNLYAKILILTFHYNSPELIELQHTAFQKFMLDNYEMIVFNDADTAISEQAIQTTCEKLHISCIRYDQKWHESDPLNARIIAWKEENPCVDEFLGGFRENPSQHPSVRHCHLIQYALDHFGYCHNDLIAIVDGDLFPIRPIHLRELLSDCEIIGIEGFRAPFIAFHPQLLPDVKDLKFSVSLLNGKFHDSGSDCQYYLRAHPSIRFKQYPQINSSELRDLPLQQLTALGFTEDEARLIQALPPKYNFEFHIDKNLIHFGSSTSNLLGLKIKLKRIYSTLNF